MKKMFNVTTILPHNLLQTNPCIRHNLLWRPEKVRKCSAAQGPHSEVVPRAFGRLVSKSCDECKGLFARGCEAKRWSHWTCSSLGTVFQPMRINSVPDVKCFCNNKNVLCAQPKVWHFVGHPVIDVTNTNIPAQSTSHNKTFEKLKVEHHAVPFFVDTKTRSFDW